MLGALLLGGCSSGQSPCYCPSYVDCFYKTGGAPQSLEATYGPMGTCWATEGAVGPCCQHCNAEVAKLKTNPAAIDAGCTFDRAVPFG